MDIRFDPKNSVLYAGERLRYNKDGFYKETVKPFFLIRFFRWIRGQYSHRLIHHKINQIAVNMLTFPEKSSINEWRQFKRNFEIISREYRNPTQRHYSNDLYQRINNKIIELWRFEPAPQAKKNHEKPVMANEPTLTDNEQTTAINTELKKRWHDAILLADADEDEEEITPLDEGWEDQPLNSEGPFVEILSTPEGLLELVIPTGKYKIKKKAKEGNTVETISELLKALSIPTPKACMQNKIEPTLESMKDYFKNNEATFLKALKGLGYIKKID